MATLTAVQANELAINFLKLAQAVGEFRISHRNQLSPAENKNLANWQWEIMSQGEDMLAASTVLVMTNAKSSLATLDSITTQITKDIAKIKAIHKGIDLVAAILELGKAIMSKKPLAIFDNLVKVQEVWKLATTG